MADSFLEHACHFRSVCGREHVFVAGEGQFADYEVDQTLDWRYSYDILVRPGNAGEVAAVLKICQMNKIPVTARGGGSGVTGGALPVGGGVVLSMERLNRVIRISKDDKYVIAEAGIITDALCEAVEQEGLYFPARPSSSGFSTIGGNVALNAGSIRSCKYGKTGDYVMNLEVALGTGELLWTAADVRKNSSGLNLTPLFAGSEGMLGVITKVVCRLMTKPGQELFLLAAFDDLDGACQAIGEVGRCGVVPSVAELICRNALELTAGWLESPQPLMDVSAAAHLLIGIEERIGMTEAVDRIVSILERYTQHHILVGETAAEKERLTRLRFSIGKAMVSRSMKYRDVDVCVPFSELSAYVKKAEEICRRYAISLVCFGHALDGNLHTMFVMDSQEGIDSSKCKNALQELYTYAISVGGVISGEHGIGLLQREYLPLQYSEAHLNWMRELKRMMDPNGILNPGKSFAI